jgi:phosphopantetheine--protein transferase-like protein
VPLGNDIVDLEEAGLEIDGRFVARVCAPDERAQLARAPSSMAARRALWRMWAAKESAYKAWQRAEAELGFHHRAFAVDLDGAEVRLGGRRLALRWSESPAHVACVAAPAEATVLSAWATLDAAPARPLSPRERASVRGEDARAVRALAKVLLVERLGAPWDAIEIVRAPGVRRLGPPEVWLRDAPLPSVTVSLSHHGRFVSCAVTVGEAA